MSVQELVVYLIGAGALAYLVVRRIRRRATGNCCGEKKCPASAGMVDKIERLRRDPPASG